MKKRSKKKSREIRWTDYFRRAKGDEYGPVRFYVRGSNSYHYSDCGYTGGHDETDRLVERCKSERFPCKRVSSGSPANVSSYETYYRFLDGGMALYSGNYLFCEPGQGTYLYGFRALRWALDQLRCPQPRKLKGEVRLRLVPPVNPAKRVSCDSVRKATASARGRLVVVRAGLEQPGR